MDQLENDAIGITKTDALYAGAPPGANRSANKTKPMPPAATVRMTMYVTPEEKEIIDQVAALHRMSPTKFAAHVAIQRAIALLDKHREEMEARQRDRIRRV